MESLPALLFMVLMAGAFYALVVRPQKARYERLQAVQDGLAPGTRVMTTAGLYGTVVGVDEETVDLEVAPGVQVRWARAAVAKTVVEDAAAPDDASR